MIIFNHRVLMLRVKIIPQKLQEDTDWLKKKKIIPQKLQEDIDWLKKKKKEIFSDNQVCLAQEWKTTGSCEFWYMFKRKSGAIFGKNTVEDIPL